MAVVDLGIDPNSLEETFHIRVVNIVGALATVISSYYTIFYAMAGFDAMKSAIVVNLCFVIAYGSVLPLNAFRYYKAASIALYIVAFAHISVSTRYLSWDSGIALYFLGMASVSVIATSDDQKITRGVVIGLSPFLLIYNYFAFQEPAVPGLDEWVAPFFFIVSAITNIGAVVITLYIYAQRLSAAQQSLRTALHYMPDVMFVIDKRGRIIEHNDHMADLFGLRAAQVYPGLYMSELLALLRQDAEAIEGSTHTEPALSEVLFLDGKQHRFVQQLANQRTFDFAIVPTPDDTTVVVAQDISKRVAVESELRASKDFAEKANLAKSEFLASMSHELRTPLNAILGFAQFMHFDPNHQLSRKQVEHVDSILSGGRHLLALVNDILDLSRIEADQFQLNISTADIKAIVDDAVEMVQPLADQNDITLEPVVCDEGNFMAQTDPDRVRQIAINLISNAIKYNYPGGWVAVLLSHEKSAGGLACIRLTIKDNGVGISEEDRQNIFQMFQRLDEDAMVAKEGTGIGLYVCQMLIQKLGGQVDFTSRLHEGSTFWVDIPITVPVSASGTQEIEAVGEPSVDT